MKIGIVIATYKRKDGKSKFYVERALKSLLSQTIKNFKVFLIGDKYEDEEEFSEFSKLIEIGYSENLPYAKEREKYIGGKLWCSGGVNAINHGISIAKSEGFDWIINLDHDDYFLPEHVSDMSNIILKEDPIFVCSKSSYINRVLPNLAHSENYSPFIPFGTGLIKSSACVDFSKINFSFRDVFSETGREAASDADFWDRLNLLIKNKNFKSFCTNKVTCIHDTEGYSLSNS